MDPNFYDLRYFVEAANVGNISRAADRLGITQPSLSQSIRRLEGSMGVTLFLRSKKGIELTSAGQRLRQHVQQLLDKWESVTRAAKNSADEVSGVMRLGCHVSVGLYTLPHFLPALIKKHSIEVQLTHDHSRKITDQVVQFQLDLGIVINPVAHPDLVIKKLTTDVVTVWGVEGAAEVLIYDPQIMQAQQILKKLRLARDGRVREIHTTSLELATRLASEGAGLAILPTRIVREHGSGKLKPIKGAPHIDDDIALIYRHENRNLKTLETFASAIQRVFG